MKINPKDYYELNEEAAFARVLSLLFDECRVKFNSLIGTKDGWLDESNYELYDYLVDKLKTHVDRIEQGGYEEDDLIDIVNYTVILFNLYKGEV